MSSCIALTISVDDVSTIVSLYDQIKVYRSVTGIGGPFVEMPGAIPLVAGKSVYQFVDTSGDPAYYYRTTYFNSTTLDESEPSSPVRGLGSGSYVTIQDLRDNGITETMLSDADALERIRKWEAFIDKSCGQFFIPRDKEIIVDGTGSRTLMLNIPIIDVSELYVNDSTTPAESGTYRVCNGRGQPNDDRLNPKIILKETTGSIFKGTNSLVFLKGVDQVIRGTFGYVEEDGSTPKAIKWAVMRLVVLDSRNLTSVVPGAIGGSGGGGGSVPVGPLVEEWTDGHKKKWGDGSSSSSSSGSKAKFTLTGDPEVDMAISMYRRPIGIRVTMRDWNA